MHEELITFLYQVKKYKRQAHQKNWGKAKNNRNKITIWIMEEPRNASYKFLERNKLLHLKRKISLINDSS